MEPIGLSGFGSKFLKDLLQESLFESPVIGVQELHPRQDIAGDPQRLAGIVLHLVFGIHGNRKWVYPSGSLPRVSIYGSNLYLFAYYRMSYDFLTCEYLDASLQPASDMLNRCVQDPRQGYDFHCRDQGPTEKPNEMNSLAIQRGHEVGIESSDSPSLTQRIGTMMGHEGFANRVFPTDTGLGESTVTPGTCPQGYTKCPTTGTCIQVCVGCDYHDHMKSKEFNEADPCFPNGVLAGYTNSGQVKCTCGDKNQYCPASFTNLFGTDGSYTYNQRTKHTIGLPNMLEKLFLLDQL
jgi:hypothetical protein